MNADNLTALLRELIVRTGESEWVEFKCSYVDPVEIGQYLSAIANAAALHHKEKGYLIWGVDNDTHQIVGTTFTPRSTKKGNEELESWLGQFLFPRVDFRIDEFEYETKPIVLFEVPAALHTPVRFQIQKTCAICTVLALKYICLCDWKPTKSYSRRLKQ